jgi:hypothetical protein
VANLREIKLVTSGIMGTEAGKRASAGALDYSYIGVAFGKLGAGSIEILYFNPEMIDSGAPSGTARYDGDTDVTIANGNRASFSISVARYVHVEIGPVEHAERRVIVIPPTSKNKVCALILVCATVTALARDAIERQTCGNVI